MSIIAEFSVSSPGLTLVEATAAVPSVKLELTSQIAVEPDQPVLFFWVTGADLTAFDEAIRSDWTVTDIEVQTDLGERRLYRAKLSDEVELVSYPVWVEAGASQLEATCQEGSWYNRMRFPDREAFQEVREWCRDNDISFTLHSLYTETDVGHGEDATPLSPRQERTVERAYRKGFYEVPQETTLSEVATEQDISQQAVSEQLRRAHRTLVERHVLDGD